MIDETRLARIRAMLEDTERARERLHGLMGPSDRPRAPVLQAALDLLAFAEAALPILRAVADKNGFVRSDCFLCGAKTLGWTLGMVHTDDCPVMLARRALGAEGSEQW